MAVSAYWFGKAFTSAFNKEIDLDSDTIKCALFTSAHAPDQDNDQYYDGTHGMTEVANGNGYTTGGATLTNPTVSYNGTTNVWTFDADDVQWTNATFTFRYACVYDATPTSNKPFICYVDFGSDVSVVSGTLTIQWSTDGIARVTVS